MTVCIAALCQYRSHSYVVGAADRMITSGDIESTAQQPKIRRITDNIAALISGDIEPHSYAVDKSIAHFLQQPNPRVEDVARFFADRLNEYRRKHAELHAFGDLGLTAESFVDKQGAMSPTIASNLHFIFQSHWKACEAIICGRDLSGAHIYEIDNKGSITSRNNIGYTSVGFGARHAKSQFMFARHAVSNPLEDTLFLVYRSKKYAEAAPGVGPDTDLFFVGGLDQVHPFTEETKNVLERSYIDYLKCLVTSEVVARKATAAYLQQVWSGVGNKQ